MGGGVVTPHLGPGEGPEENGGILVGPGGLTITEQLLLSLRLSGWPSALSPTLSSGCRGPDIGEALEESSVSSPQPLHLPHPLAVSSSLITFPPPIGPCLTQASFTPHSQNPPWHQHQWWIPRAAPKPGLRGPCKGSASSPRASTHSHLPSPASIPASAQLQL